MDGRNQAVQILFGCSDSSPVRFYSWNILTISSSCVMAMRGIFESPSCTLYRERADTMKLTEAEYGLVSFVADSAVVSEYIRL